MVLRIPTIVVVDGAILGKPRGKDDALRMMSILSGRTHQVMSAVAMVANDSALRLSISEVGMRSTTDAEREAYWDSGEPADKAGAYAIRDWQQCLWSVCTVVIPG